MTDRRKVMITGCGLVTAHGDLAPTWQGLMARRVPVRRGFSGDCSEFPFDRSYGIEHFDPSEYIPARSDVRAMGTSMRYATVAAGRALTHAGLSASADALSRAGLFVAARFGERDADVDFGICNEIAGLESYEAKLNALLLRQLRPGAFLAQLPNLFAGNISLLFQIRGPSMTFVGEQGAGSFALAEASNAIRAGELDVAVVGGCFNGDEYQTRFALAGSGCLAPDHDAQDLSPVQAWSTQARGTVPGVAAAFVVLESREHASARGALLRAELAAATTDTCPRSRRSVSASLALQYERWLAVGQPVSAFMGNGSGITAVDLEELRFLSKAGISTRTTGLTSPAPGLGEVFHASLPLRVALATAALERNQLFGVPDDDTRHAMPEGIELLTQSRHEQTELQSICALSLGALESQSMAIVCRPDAAQES